MGVQVLPLLSSSPFDEIWVAQPHSHRPAVSLSLKPVSFSEGVTAGSQMPKLGHYARLPLLCDGYECIGNRLRTGTYHWRCWDALGVLECIPHILLNASPQAEHVGPSLT